MVPSYYNDSELTPESTFAAGTMTLAIGEEGSRHMDVGPVYPGWGTSTYPSTQDASTQTIVIINEGDVQGRLKVMFTDIVNYEGGVNEPESLVDGTTGEMEGELGDHLFVTIAVEGEEIHPATVINEAGELDGSIDLGSIGPGESKVMVLKHHVDEEVGNIIQSDSISFTILVHLEQDMAPSA